MSEEREFAHAEWRQIFFDRTSREPTPSEAWYAALEWQAARQSDGANHYALRVDPSHAIRKHEGVTIFGDPAQVLKVMVAIEGDGETVQEPVAWMYEGTKIGTHFDTSRIDHYFSNPDGSYIKGTPLYAAPIGDNGVQQKDEHARERIARALHYPACWDTAAYPTLDSAALEAIACAKLGCSECEKPYDAPAGPVYRCNQCGSFDIERYPYAASQPAESKRVELTEEQWRIIQAPTGSLLFDAGVHSACTRIRELLARASAKGE